MNKVTIHDRGSGKATVFINGKEVDCVLGYQLNKKVGEVDTLTITIHVQNIEYIRSKEQTVAGGI